MTRRRGPLEFLRHLSHRIGVWACKAIVVMCLGGIVAIHFHLAQ
jgi:hypothetical protein